MEHTIIILEHKNISQVVQLVKYFKHNCRVIIHIDKKKNIAQKYIDELNNLQQVVTISQEYNVNWGGFSILECEISMLNKGLQLTDSDYFHLISGQDYPVKPLDYFLSFFEKQKGKNFIQYTHLPHSGWEGNTFKRFQYYYPYDYAGNKKNPKQWVWEQVKEQQKKGIKRPIPDEFDHLYGGSQWFSITREAASILIDYTLSYPNLYKKMWMTFAPEESYIPTVLVNLINNNKIINFNHRYIRWQNENGNRPANLGPEHLYYLFERDYLFARKIEFPISEPIIKLIDNYLLNDRNIYILSNGGWDYNGYIQYIYDEKFYRFIAQFCREVGVSKALDAGCGSGFYVSKWRRIGLNFYGIDANPNTPFLSKQILPKDSEPCDVADLTNINTLSNKWDLVVCKDVIQYIPLNLKTNVINNLCYLSSHYIIMSYTRQYEKNIPDYPIRWEDITQQMEKNGFCLDEYLTARIQVVSSVNTQNLIYRKQYKSIFINN